MKISTVNRQCWPLFVLPVMLAGLMSTSARAIPSFQSSDWRLPNPDRPYEMTSGTVLYDVPSLYDLKIQISDPSQLDTPTHTFDGDRLEFDSTFDITYTAIISRSLEPPHPVTGTGKARAVGITRPDENPPFTYPHPQVFDTELVSLNLFELTTRPEIGMMLRESPTLQSKGVIIREDPCPACAAPFSHWNISSFFDIYTEITFDGVNWSPANVAIHVEQAPDGSSPGDYNNDQVVDARDYVVWRTTFGQIGAGLTADGDWSGKVDAGDFAVWQANYGRANGFLSFSTAGTAVPEPVSWLLALTAAVAPVVTRRRLS